jgi:copper(I)-binding protein
VSRTARTRPTAPRTYTALFAGALVGALALTGCGAGQIAGTAEQQAAVSGNNTSVGPIAVRDAVIAFGEEVEGGAVYTSGAAAPLSMTIVNEGTEADTLVSASSPWASSVEISGETRIPAGRSIVVQGETPELTPTSGVPSSGSPSAAPTTPAAEPPSGTQIVLTGLRDDIRAGVSYDVTLVFERAGEVVVQAPVGSTEEPREDEPAE